MTSTVYVTGGNRGIGLEIVRGYAKAGYKVIMGCRDEEAGEEAKKDIVGGDVQIRELDLTDTQSVATEIGRAEAVYGDIDILVNNAGIYEGGTWEESEVGQISQSMQLHVSAPFALIKQALPGMIERNFGRIVNVSSGYGSFDEGMAGSLPYSISKAALNALTLSVAENIDSDANVKVNAMCPGWVHTRLGGSDAPRSPEEGADTAIWLGQIDKDGPSGQFFRDRKPIKW